MSETLFQPIVNENECILQVKNIIKEFSGVRVLDNVNFDLRKGEVHALLGENGAGKSTLVKIVTGVYTKSSGEIYLDGKIVNIKDKATADKLGIGIIFQEFSQVSQLSVAENLFLGKMQKKSILGGLIKYIDWKYIKEKASISLKEFGLDVKASTKVSQLGVAKKQILEIIKAFHSKARILIMDEPTASLSSEEIEYLFSLIAELKNKGVSIIYISHRLEEVRGICDRVTVLRDGKNVGTMSTNEATVNDIIKLMIGKDIQNLYPKKGVNLGENVLELRNLTYENKFRDVNFVVHEGEILGITGLVGAGKTEIAQAVFGINADYKGEILLKGKLIKKNNPSYAKKMGLALVPEDRQYQGLIMKLKASDNIALPNLKQFKNVFDFINLKKEKEVVMKYFKSVDIRPAEPNKLAKQFSGGNQQKIVISKWLCAKARLYMFDEPTRGIDVGAKTEIYKLIVKLAEQGNAIIIFSSEVQEIIGMCDKIVVMNRGEISAILDKKDADVEKIIRHQIGGIEEV